MENLSLTCPIYMLTPPFTGAWIEISDARFLLKRSCGRTLHGCVDWNCAGRRSISCRLDVAPFTGAWIEIIHAPRWWGEWHSVAPFTGAWIEIGWYVAGMIPAGIRSHPSRVRGLKCKESNGRHRRRQESHPSRVRGLKFGDVDTVLDAHHESHPSRVRGLKSYGAS